MCDDKHPGLIPYTALTRRSFAALGAAAGASLAAPAYAQAKVVERDVEVKTADGVADSALFLPVGRGRWPGVLFWPDGAGMRASIRDMGKRLAGQGYVVLVVNPFYRSGSVAALAAAGTGLDPAAQQQRRAAIRALMTDEAMSRDGKTFVGYLDALAETSNAKVGVQGYCMGGALSFRTAAAAPDRVGAVGSFHGGGLVTPTSASPHLLIEKTKARYVVAIGRNDDANDPKAKDVLRETFAKHGRPATVEVYGGNHGWCVPDNSQYVQAEAERAWAALTALYKTALV